MGKPVFLMFVFLSICLTGCKDPETKPVVEEGFVEIFNGQNLDGWEGNTDIWRVEKGLLIGELTPETPLEQNSFLTWKEEKPSDFELKTEFRITEEGNSGINYRSAKVEGVPYGLKGYQADIDGRNNYTGQNYEERGRTTLAYRGELVRVNPVGPTDSIQEFVQNNAWTERNVTGSLGSLDSLGTLIKNEDWNQLHIKVNGNRLQHYINGVLMSDVTDKDSIHRSSSGFLGLQLHVGPPMKVEYRNLRFKEL